MYYKVGTVWIQLISLSHQPELPHNVKFMSEGKSGHCAGNNLPNHLESCLMLNGTENLINLYYSNPNISQVSPSYSTDHAFWEYCISLTFRFFIVQPRVERIIPQQMYIFPMDFSATINKPDWESQLMCSFDSHCFISQISSIVTEEKPLIFRLFN